MHHPIDLRVDWQIHPQATWESLTLFLPHQSFTMERQHQEWSPTWWPLQRQSAQTLFPFQALGSTWQSSGPAFMVNSNGGFPFKESRLKSYWYPIENDRQQQGLWLHRWGQPWERPALTLSLWDPQDSATLWVLIWPQAPPPCHQWSTIPLFVQHRYGQGKSHYRQARWFWTPEFVQIEFAGTEDNIVLTGSCQGSTVQIGARQGQLEAYTLPSWEESPTFYWALLVLLVVVFLLCGIGTHLGSSIFFPQRYQKEKVGWRYHYKPLNKT